ncbi:MAG: glycoside hydrolase family 3 protein, partial [Deltaproteobacteria bacterium]|nr:glycoside hydrolase family 3 protein [Deltaproteobacteria bacterium]
MRAGRLFVLGFDGTTPPEWLFRFAGRFGLGGVILFRKNCPDAETVRALLSETKEGLAKVDPGWRHLAFVDQEGG